MRGVTLVAVEDEILERQVTINHIKLIMENIRRGGQPLIKPSGTAWVLVPGKPLLTPPYMFKGEVKKTPAALVLVEPTTLITSRGKLCRLARENGRQVWHNTMIEGQGNQPLYIRAEKRFLDSLTMDQLTELLESLQEAVGAWTS